ncbi:MAG: pilus assembly protein HicB [Bacteroidaceae bacterium]|nr:pilus assembly protein HicB [Bacteroidaceae bacterium]
MNEINGNTMLTACGQSVKEAKEDLLCSLEEVKAYAEEHGQPLQELDLEYKYDLQSFFSYFSYLNITEIAKRAEINPSLLRQYARGLSRAGEKTYERLSQAMTAIVNDLQCARF